MSGITEEYPVVHYNPTHYVPVDVFKDHWNEFKTHAADRVADPYGRNPNAGPFSAAFSASAPMSILVSIIIIAISTMGTRSVNPQASVLDYLNFSMVLALVIIFVNLVILHKNVKFATRLKDSVDFAMLESVRRYLKQRYGFIPNNWESRFISYLSDEDVKESRFSETHELTVRNHQGRKVIMVCNINGEAPVKK